MNSAKKSLFNLMALVCLVIGLSSCASIQPGVVKFNKPKVTLRAVGIDSESGPVSEEDIQEALSKKIEMKLPGRLAVYEVALTPQTDEAKSDVYQLTAEEQKEWKKVLRESKLFSIVDVPDLLLPNKFDLKALRLAAANVKADLLFVFAKKTNMYSSTNGLAIFYITIIGSLFVPGDTAECFTSATGCMVDVASGDILFGVTSGGHAKNDFPRAASREGKRKAFVESEMESLKEMGDKIAKYATQLSQLQAASERK